MVETNGIYERLLIVHKHNTMYTNDFLSYES